MAWLCGLGLLGLGAVARRRPVPEALLPASRARRISRGAGRAVRAVLLTDPGARALRRREALDRWPELIRNLAALLAAGAEPARAWQVLAARRENTEESRQESDGPDELVRAGAAAARIGADVPAALRRVRCRDAAGRSARDSLAAAWAVSASSGAPLAAVLEHLAEAVEDDLDARDARETALAGPRSTGRILAGLPLLGLGLGLLMGTDPVGVLLQSLGGRIALVLGLVLAGLGLVWTRRMVRTAEEVAP